MSKFRTGVLAAMTVAGFAASSPALATSTSVFFSAVVTSVDSALTGQFYSGQVIDGNFNYDPSTAATAGSNSTTAVFNALTLTGITVGSHAGPPAYIGSSTASAEIQMGNKGGACPGSPCETTDRFAVVSRVSDGLTPWTFASANNASIQETLTSFILRMDQNAGTLWNTALTLPTSLNSSNFDSGLIFLSFAEPTDPVVTAELLGLSTIIGVPEPSSLSIIAAALIMLGALRWRTRHRAC